MKPSGNLMPKIPKILKTPKIGIVSGVGPLAGSDVFAKLLQYAAQKYGAVEDSEYPDIMLINHGIEGVDNTGALSDQFGTAIAGMVAELDRCGATVIGIACNTAHLYLDKLHPSSKVELVNLIDHTARAAKEAAPAGTRYLLLTSQTSKEQQLYQGYLQQHTVQFATTDDTQQQLLDKAIGLVMAYELDEAGQLLDQVVASAKKAGFSAVIAGCTELPIALAHAKMAGSLQVIDSNTVLAQALADAYYAQQTTYVY